MTPLLDTSFHYLLLNCGGRIRNLEPGRWENIQAQSAFKVIYDDWDSYYRVELEKLLGVPVLGDVWGDLRYVRQSLTHRRNIGVDELKKAKLIKDFLPGVPIVFTSTVMDKIRRELEGLFFYKK